MAMYVSLHISRQYVIQSTWNFLFELYEVSLKEGRCWLRKVGKASRPVAKPSNGKLHCSPHCDEKPTPGQVIFLFGTTASFTCAALA